MTNSFNNDIKFLSLFKHGTKVNFLPPEFKKDFLGEIPIHPEVGKLGDQGIPIVEKDPDHKISKIYLSLAEKIKSIYL